MNSYYYYFSLLSLSLALSAVGLFFLNHEDLKWETKTNYEISSHANSNFVLVVVPAVGDGGVVANADGFQV